MQDQPMAEPTRPVDGPGIERTITLVDGRGDSDGSARAAAGGPHPRARPRRPGRVLVGEQLAALLVLSALTLVFSPIFPTAAMYLLLLLIVVRRIETRAFDRAVASKIADAGAGDPQPK
jgi:hypothetical protein